VRVTARAAGVAVRITRLVIAGSDATQPHAVADDASVAASALVVDVVVAEGMSEPPPEPPSGSAVALAPDMSAATEMAPVHVSEGLQFVEAFAEPGAEEDVGAAVHVEEPWQGYAQMTADEIIARLADATREQLAVLTLYEETHRRRKTVVAAARRQLRVATASAGA
jgi:hypothetical protein